MGNFFVDQGMWLSNRAWRLAGRGAPGEPGLRVWLPDAALSQLVAGTLRDVADHVSFPLGYRMRGRWLRSSKNASAASSTETTFGSLLLRHWDPPLARDVLRVFFLNRSIEGRMPLTVRAFSTSNIPAYPFILTAVYKYHEITGDTEGTRELFLKYLKYSDWLVINHKGEGGLYYHNSEDWFRHDFMTRELIAAEPRMASRWSEAACVGLNAAMAYQYRLMSRAAMAAGEQRDARKLDNHAKKLTNFFNEKFWNEESGFYCDALGGELLAHVTPAGFLALAAEAPVRTRAERMIERLPALRDELLQSLIGNPKNAVLLYLMGEGLLKYGRAREASELALALATHAAAMSPAPDNYLTRIVAVHALIEHVIGYISLGPLRLALAPRLPDAWAGRPLKIENDLHANAIECEVNAQGRVVVRIAHAGIKKPEQVVENYHFHNVDLSHVATTPPVEIKPPDYD